MLAEWIGKNWEKDKSGMESGIGLSVTAGWWSQFGVIVLTTSAGIMDHEEARRKKVGGKVGFYSSHTIHFAALSLTCKEIGRGKACLPDTYWRDYNWVLATGLCSQVCYTSHMVATVVQVLGFFY